MSNTSLEELHHDVSSQGYPVVHTHFEHPRYSDLAPIHEAGYDSLITARVAIRLAARLAAVGVWKDDLRPDDLASSSASVANILEMTADSHDNKDGDILLGHPMAPQAQPASSKFASPGRYDLLSDYDAVQTNMKENMLPDSVDPLASDPWMSPQIGAGAGKEPSMPKWMPSWTSDFWKVYGNKVRVNGTQEGVLELAK